MILFIFQEKEDINLIFSEQIILPIIYMVIFSIENTKVY